MPWTVVPSKKKKKEFRLMPIVIRLSPQILRYLNVT